MLMMRSVLLEMPRPTCDWAIADGGAECFLQEAAGLLEDVDVVEDVVRSCLVTAADGRAAAAASAAAASDVGALDVECVTAPGWWTTVVLESLEMSAGAQP